MKILALMSDAYGGFGGIAQFNRDFLDALVSSEQVEEIVSLPRLQPCHQITTPEKLSEKASPGSRPRYLWECWKQASASRPDMIVCGHINLLPVAASLKQQTRSKLILIVHGIEAWQGGGRIRQWAISKTDLALSVSRYTRERLIRWSNLAPHRVKVIFDTIHLEQYAVSGKPAYLEARYGVGGKRVLLTLGRLSADERYKGHDRVIKLLPEIAERFPNLAYLIAGDGDDRPRLEALVKSYGIQDLVVFAGRIPDGEKVDHYNLADAFAMPSTGEGFGIVFLEAAACGLPILGGSVDGSRDALCEGNLGLMVEPNNSEELLKGLEIVLSRGREVPSVVKAFSFSIFKSHLELLMSAM